MENPCKDCKMTPESKAACCGCPERLKYEKEQEERKQDKTFVEGYSYGEKPTRHQLESALDVLKCERLARWRSMMTEQEKYEIEQAHNLCIYLLREALT